MMADDGYDPAFDGDPEAADERATIENGDAPAEGGRPPLRSLPGGTGVGGSVADRDDDGEGEEQLFPHGSLSGDPSFNLWSLFKKKHQYRIKAKMKAIPVDVQGDGLFDPEHRHNAQIRTRLSHIVVTPEYNDHGGIVGWDVVQHLFPEHISSLVDEQGDEAKAG